jgi:hypothetical protein
VGGGCGAAPSLLHAVLGASRWSRCRLSRRASCLVVPVAPSRVFVFGTVPLSPWFPSSSCCHRCSPFPPHEQLLGAVVRGALLVVVVVVVVSPRRLPPSFLPHGPLPSFVAVVVPCPVLCFFSPPLAAVPSSSPSPVSSSISSPNPPSEQLLAAVGGGAGRPRRRCCWRRRCCVPLRPRGLPLSALSMAVSTHNPTLRAVARSGGRGCWVVLVPC